MDPIKNNDNEFEIICLSPKTLTVDEHITKPLNIKLGPNIL